MTDFRTPRGFIKAVDAIKAAGKPLRLYFDMAGGRCYAMEHWENRPLTVAEVGVYDAFVLGGELTHIIRMDFKALLKGKSRPKLRLPSPTYKAAHSRRWRKTHPLTPEQRRKMNVRSHSHIALKRGQIAKHPCAICCSTRSQMHHPSYDHPLHVVWLCRKCHLRLHRAGITWNQPWSDVPRDTQCTGTEGQRLQSKSYRKNADNAGRRSV